MQTKQAYIQRLETQLATWDAELSQLKLRLDHAEPAIKQAFVKRLDRIRRRRCNAAEAFALLQHSKGDAWDLAKVVADRIWFDLRQDITSTVVKLRGEMLARAPLKCDIPI